MASSTSQLRTAVYPGTSFLLSDSPTRNFLLCLFLAAATLAVYYPVHTHPFSALDDPIYIVENTHLHQGLNWQTIYWSFRTFGMGNWIPLTWLSHALDYQLFGLNPAGHHLENVLLHAINAILVFWVLKRATGYTGRSFMVAALFALHPMNVEPVVWVAERKTMLSTLFFLLALGFYHRYAIAPSSRRYLLVVVLFGIGLLAKPQIITFPCVLLLWDYWPLQRLFPPARNDSFAPPPICPPRSFLWLVKEKIPLFCVAAVDAAATMRAQSQWHFKPPLALRLDNAVFSYWLYVKKAFWPSGMAPELPHLGRFLAPWQVAASVLFLLTVTVFVLVFRRYRYLPVGWFWFLGTMVPTIGLKQVGLQGMADRYAYISFLGIFIMVCWGISDWAERRRISPAWLAGAGAVALIALTLITSRQISYWQDELTLWNHATQVSPYHWLAQDNVGMFLMREGRTEEAIAHYRRASEINPQDGGSSLVLAQYEQKQGNLREAIRLYKNALQDKSVDLPPSLSASIWLNMAVAYRDLGDALNAQQCVDEAQDLARQGK
jgi:tetratricopeptide (TPR) repeat protein